MIALVTGVLFLALAALRMGWIARFLSKAVVTGFLAGAAVDVVIGELPKLTGTDADGDSAWRELASWVRSLGDIHPATVLVGVAALAVILALRFLAPRVPGALILVAGGLVASAGLDLGTHGVALVGEVARGLPALELPDAQLAADHLATVLIASTTLLLIGFSQTAGDARAFAARHGYRVDVDQESVAQGMANVGAGVFQGMPVSTSLSASSLNESAGARAVVFGMIDVGELRRLYRVSRFDFWIAVAAIVGVLSAGVLAGVVIGVALSLGWLIYVSTRPPMPLLSSEAGIAVLRLDSNLFFATAEALEDGVRDLLDSGELQAALVLDLEGVNAIDSQGAAKVGELHRLCATGTPRCTWRV